MPKSTAAVTVGLRLDTKDIAAMISQLANALGNLGGNVNISQVFGDQIKEMLKELSDLQNKMDTLSTSKVSTKVFADTKLDILNQIDALDQRTSALEMTVGSLIKTLSSTDGGNMSNILTMLRENMDKTAESTRELMGVIGAVTDAVGSNGSVQLFDESVLNKQVAHLEHLQKVLNSISDFQRNSPEISFMNEKDATGQLEKAINRYRELFDAYKKASPEDAGFGKLEQSLIRSVQRIYDLSDNINRSFDNIDFASDLIEQGDKIISSVSDISSRVDSQLDKVKEKLNAITSDPGYISKNGETSQVKIPIDFSQTGKGLSSKLEKIMDAVRKTANSNPIELQLDLIQKNQSKRAKKALKDLQNQVAGIEDESMRAEMESLISTVGKDFVSDFTMNLKSSFDDAQQAVKNIIKDIKQELSENPIKINPVLEFTEDEINDATAQVNALADKLNEVLSDQVKNGLLGEAPDEDYKGKLSSFAKLALQLKSIISNIQEIPSKFVEMPTGLEEGLIQTESRLSGLQDQFKNFSASDMGVSQVKELTIQLEKAKAVLEEMVQLSMGDTVGLQNLLKDFDKASWLSSGAAGSKRDASAYERLKNEYPSLFDAESDSYIGTFQVRDKDYKKWAYNIVRQVGYGEEALASFNDQEKLLFGGKFGNYEIPDFNVDPEKIKGVADNIGQIVDSLNKISAQLPNDINTANIKLDELINGFGSINSMPMGVDNFQALINKIEEAKISLGELMQLFQSPRTNLNNMLDEWHSADESMRKTYGADHLRERGAYILPDGKIVGSYTFGDTGSYLTNTSNPHIKNSIGIHSHGSDKVVFGSMANADGGDLLAFMSQYLNDAIDKQLITALYDTEVWDVAGLFKASQGNTFKPFKLSSGKSIDRVDFSDIKSPIYQAISEEFSRLINKLDYHSYLDEFIDRFGKNLGVSSFDSYFESLFREDVWDGNDGTIKQIEKIGYKENDIPGLVNKIRQRLKETGSLKEAFYSTLENGDNKNSIGSLFKEVGSFFNSNFKHRDLKMFQLQKIRKEALGRFGINPDDFIKNYTIDEFKELNPLNLDSNTLSDIFKNTGIEDFTSNVSGLSDSLEKIAKTISEVGSDGLRFGLSDDITINVRALTDSLQELIDLYKQLNNLGEYSFDKSKLFDAFKDFNTGESIDEIESKFKKIFGDNSSAYFDIWDQVRQAPDMAGDYSDAAITKWVDDFIQETQKAGLALDGFKKQQKETADDIKQFTLNIDSEQFTKLVNNTTTLKNSLNSLRKETDFSSIIESIEKLGSTLLEFSEVVQKSTGILSSSKLESAFERIKVAASLMNGRSGKDQFTLLAKAFDAYKGAGGTAKLEELGGTEKFQEKLHKYYDEIQSLKEVAPAAEEASSAKIEFSEANRILLQSIIQSVAGIENEGKAFQNLTKMFNTLGNEDTSKLERVKKALQEIITLLNTEVGANSFITSLENLASTGDTLKDLATVLKATKKQIANATTATNQNSGAPQFDYAQERLNQNAEEINKAGVNFLSQYGVVIDTVLKENSDGLLEFIGIVKTAEKELTQFTLTSADGNHFNIKSREANSPKLAKQWLQWQRMQKAWEAMQKVDPHITDEIVFDPNKDKKNRQSWEDMKNVAELYKDYIGDLQKVTRQVRQDPRSGELLESFSFFGDKGHITMGREGDLVASHQDLENIKDVDAAYKELTNTAKNYYQLKMKEASGNASDYELRQIDEIENRYNELLRKVTHFQTEFGDTTASQSLLKYQETISKQFDDYLNQTSESFMGKIDKIKLARSNQRNDFTPDFKDELDETLKAWERVTNLKYKHQNGEIWSTSELKEVATYLERIDELYLGITDKQNILARTEDVDKLIKQASRDLNDNSLSSDLAGRYQDLINKLQEVRVAGDDAAEGCAKINQVEYGKLKAQLLELQAEMQRTGQTGKGFWKQFAGAITSKSANFLAQYFSLQDIIRYGKELSQVVTQIDSANIELKKVSDASNDRIQQSFLKSTQTAQELGSTITEVINSTADWARLNSRAVVWKHTA